MTAMYPEPEDNYLEIAELPLPEPLPDSPGSWSRRWFNDMVMRQRAEILAARKRRDYKPEPIDNRDWEAGETQYMSALCERYGFRKWLALEILYIARDAGIVEIAGFPYLRDPIPVEPRPWRPTIPTGWDPRRAHPATRLMIGGLDPRRVDPDAEDIGIAALEILQEALGFEIPGWETPGGQAALRQPMDPRPRLLLDPEPEPAADQHPA